MAVGIFDDVPILLERVHLDDMSDRYLLQTTRLSRGLFTDILSRIEPQLTRPTLRANALALQEQDPTPR